MCERFRPNSSIAVTVVCLPVVTNMCYGEVPLQFCYQVKIIGESKEFTYFSDFFSTFMEHVFLEEISL